MSKPKDEAEGGVEVPLIWTAGVSALQSSGQEINNNHS